MCYLLSGLCVVFLVVKSVIKVIISFVFVYSVSGVVDV